MQEGGRETCGRRAANSDSGEASEHVSLWQVAKVVEKLKDVDRNSFLQPVWSGEQSRNPPNHNNTFLFVLGRGGGRAPPV